MSKVRIGLEMTELRGTKRTSRNCRRVQVFRNVHSRGAHKPASNNSPELLSNARARARVRDIETSNALRALGPRPYTSLTHSQNTNENPTSKTSFRLPLRPRFDAATRRSLRNDVEEEEEIVARAPLGACVVADRLALTPFAGSVSTHRERLRFFRREMFESGRRLVSGLLSRGYDGAGFLESHIL